MYLPIHTPNYKNRQAQCGLSLIELMIAITIGLLILAALSTLFVNQSRTRAELDKSNRMIDNGRYAMEVLSENVQLAGYYGGADTPTIPTSANPCDSASSSAALVWHVQGYNAADTSSTIASPPCSLVAKDGSDILVLRRAKTSVAASLATANLLTQTYFVSPENETDDGIPTLKRIDLDHATGTVVTTPLVEGIEFMQIEYGLDGVDSDGVADDYIAAPIAENWPNIVSVKINLIARNLEQTTGYTDTKTYSLGDGVTYTPAAGDHYKRHAYTQAVRLVNPSSRRETP